MTFFARDGLRLRESVLSERSDNLSRPGNRLLPEPIRVCCARVWHRLLLPAGCHVTEASPRQCELGGM